MQNKFHDIHISRLTTRSANRCLSLAARTFGIESQQFKTVQSFTKDKRAGYVAILKDRIVGFIVYDNRGFAIADVLAIAVDKSILRLGLGRKLLARVTRLPRQVVTINVAETLLDTQLFLRSQGFKAIKIEHAEPCDYYVFQKVMKLPVDPKQPVSNLTPQLAETALP
ncbi:MAG: GNAT family N-acetyltransferase [Thermoguttaceae bacterium]